MEEGWNSGTAHSADEDTEAQRERGLPKVSQSVKKEREQGWNKVLPVPGQSLMGQVLWVAPIFCVLASVSTLSTWQLPCVH